MFIAKAKILSIRLVETRVQGENSMQLSEKKGPYDFYQNEVCPSDIKNFISCQVATTKQGKT
jgi:hypothetical protein